MSIKKKCANPLCSQMIPRSFQPPYCEEHDPTAKANKHYDLYQRDPKTKEFYSSNQWRNFRRTVLAEHHYLCSECGKNGNTIHHIIEVKDDWSKRFERENTTCVCQSCHNEIHK